MSKPFRNLTVIGLLAAIALFIFSFFARRLHVDEAVLADPAFWLAKDGYLHSEGLRGWQHAENKFLFTHKLYLYAGGLFVQLFGWSAATVKSVSLAYLVGLLATAWGIFRHFKVEKIWFVLFAFLLLTNAHVFELGFVFRPEIAVALLALGCYFLLQLYLETNLKKYLIAAGAIAALGIGHHLNGVIIPGAGCLLLIYNRRFLPMLVFGVIASFGFAFHLLGVSSTADFQMMISQFRNMQDIGTEHFSAFHYVLNILNEQQRYLHSPREIAFTVLVLPIIIMGRKTLWQNYRALFVYTAAGAICLAIIAHGKDTKYLTLLIPLMLILTTLAIRSFPKGKSQTTAIVLIALSVGTQSFFNFSLSLLKDHRQEIYESLSHGEIPEGSHILAPVYAVFWAVPKYRTQSFISYQFRAAHQDFKKNIESLNKELDRHNIDYVFFEKEEMDLYKPTAETMPKFVLKDYYSTYPNEVWFYKRVKE